MPKQRGFKLDSNILRGHKHDLNILRGHKHDHNTGKKVASHLHEAVAMQRPNNPDEFQTLFNPFFG